MWGAQIAPPDLKLRLASLNRASCRLLEPAVLTLLASLLLQSISFIQMKQLHVQIQRNQSPSNSIQRTYVKTNPISIVIIIRVDDNGLFSF
jgi:hypothetical protein